MKRTRMVMAIAASLVSAAALAHWGGGNDGNPGYGPGGGMMGGGGMGMGMGTGMMIGGGSAGMCGGAGPGPGYGAGLELTGEQRAKIADIQRETHADARKRIEAVLTDEHKQKLGKANMGPRW